MAIKAVLVDPLTNQPVSVTKFGQLVVSPVDYSLPSADDLIADDTPVNFIRPKTGKQIVITGILVAASRSVGNNGSLVEIYEADSATSSTIIELILSADLARQQARDLTALNLIVPVGTWVNAKADSTPVSVTILYYYIPAD